MVKNPLVVHKTGRSRSQTNKQGQAGFDNIRENIDPHVKTKVVSSKNIIAETLHAIRGTAVAGAAPSVVFDRAILESNTTHYLNFISGAGTSPGILFSDDSRGAGGIYYSHGSDRFTIQTDNTNAFRINSSQQIDCLTHKILNVVDPTDNQDAATKKYVDDVVIATPTLQEVTDEGNTTTNSMTSTSDLTGSTLNINDGVNQPYKITNRADGIVFQGQTAGTFTAFDMFSKDGDGTDAVQFDLFAKGSPASIAISERLLIRYVTAPAPEYRIHTDAAGVGGDDHNINLFTVTGGAGQLVLSTSGNIELGNATDNTKLFFGAGQDASIYYNGTDIEIDPREVGTGLLRVHGDMEVREDANVRSDINSKNIFATGTTTSAAVSAETANNRIWLFSHGPGRTAVRQGVTIADYGEFLSSTGNGMLFSTTNSAHMLFGTASTRAMEIDASQNIIVSGGDFYFTGDGTGLPYGAMYQTAGSTFTTTLTNQNTDYELDAATTNINAGELNLCTFPDDHYILVQKAGRYLINYTFSAAIDSVAGGSQHVESGIMINGTTNVAGVTHWTFAATGTENAYTGTAILDLAANDQISLSLNNNTSAGKIMTIDHLNVNVTQLGGT